jgi:SAM-dependent methyltransferase
MDVRAMIDVQPNSFSNKFRSKRFSIFGDMVAQILEQKKLCRILDVGGTVAYWKAFGGDLDWNKLQVVILNLRDEQSSQQGISFVAGDARNIKEFDDLSFDIVHSNSVIEHVGRWDDMMLMAKEVRRLAARHFVQTPYFWFPIEPHARFPFFHWLPEPMRYRLIMNRTCGYWQRQDNVGDAIKTIQDAVLLDKQQMHYLFPDSRIVPETVLGVTKSLIAIR